MNAAHTYPLIANPQLGRTTMYTITDITIKIDAALGRALNVELHTVPRELWDRAG
jgi:hypothetical protein